MKKNKILNSQVIIYFILFFFVLTGYAFATNYYVNGSTGSDSYNGLYETFQGGSNGPWETLGKTTSSVGNGNHTINIAAGTYSETVSITSSGSSPGYHHYKANGAVSVYYIYVNGAWVKVEGFTCVGTGSATSYNGAITLSDTADNCHILSNVIQNVHRIGIYLGGPDSCTIESNVVNGAESAGLDIRGTNHLVINNDISHVRDAGWADLNFIWANGSGHTFRGNYLHNLTLDDITGNPHIDAFQTAAGDSNYFDPLVNCIFEKNHIFMGDDSTGLLINSVLPMEVHAFMVEGSSTQTVSGLTIRNNIIESHAGFNIGSSQHVSNVKIYNNLWRGNLNSAGYPIGISLEYVTTYEIYNNILIDFYMVHIYLYGSSGTYDYNLMWNSNGTTTNLNGYTPQSNDKRSVSPSPIYNPTFTSFVTNMLSSNYHLQVTSPAKDTGFTIATVTDDYAGTARPQGAAYDIGAYEYDATPPVMSSPTPSGTQNCTSDPRSVDIGINTDENATCKYDTSDTTYDLMENTFTTTGGLSHSKTLSLACGAGYTYYVECMDIYGNKSESSESITFSITATEILGSISIEVGVGTKTITIGGGSQTITINP